MNKSKNNSNRNKNKENLPGMKTYVMIIQPPITMFSTEAKCGYGAIKDHPILKKRLYAYFEIIKIIKPWSKIKCCKSLL